MSEIKIIEHSMIYTVGSLVLLRFYFHRALVFSSWNKKVLDLILIFTGAHS